MKTILNKMLSKIWRPNRLSDPARYLSPQEAFNLAGSGQWVKWAGYYWRNNDKYGQYMAYGDYPECIRTCKRFEREAFDKPNAKWESYFPDNAKD